MAVHSYYVYTVCRNSNIHMNRLRKMRSSKATVTLGVSLGSTWISLKLHLTESPPANPAPGAAHNYFHIHIGRGSTYSPKTNKYDDSRNNADLVLF